MNIYLIVSIVREYCSRGEKFLKRGYSEAIVKDFFSSRFLSTLTGGRGGKKACAILVLRESACEVICRELAQHF